MSHLEPKPPLELLDPGYEDPGYWRMFQWCVMEAARPHLARRRRAHVTVGSVMVSWSRMILPATVAVAGVALLLLFGGSSLSEVENIVGVEEVLGVPADGETPLPSFLHSDESVDRDAVLFAVEQF